MTSLKLAVVVIVMMGVTMIHSAELGHFITKRALVLDEHFAPIATAEVAEERSPLLRQPRDTGYGHEPHKGYGHEPHKGYKSYTPGKVGPVYTFVKTDYNGNFKWGVRHRAGVKYAGGYH